MHFVKILTGIKIDVHVYWIINTCISMCLVLIWNNDLIEKKVKYKFRYSNIEDVKIFSLFLSQLPKSRLT